MQININKAHYPVTVLGPGRRIGIWVQGCRIACPGCVSQDTWDKSINRRMPVSQLLAWCRKVASPDVAATLDGITISGGEPFDQPDALSALLDALIAWRTELNSDFDILCYSGYPYNTLKHKHGVILGKLDALIPEPYLDQQPTTLPWRGSDNQTLELLSERARSKYAAHESSAAPPQLQVMLDGQQVWYIGIPQRGDMQKLETQCRDQGILFRQPSWRT